MGDTKIKDSAKKLDELIEGEVGFSTAWNIVVFLKSLQADNISILDAMDQSETFGNPENFDYSVGDENKVKISKLADNFTNVARDSLDLLVPSVDGERIESIPKSLESEAMETEEHLWDWERFIKATLVLP